MVNCLHVRPLIIAMVAAGIILTYPVMASYSPAYGALSKEKKQEFDALMKKGDAAYNTNDYTAAARYFDAATTICPSDYTAVASYGRAQIAEGGRTDNHNTINEGCLALMNVGTMMKNQGISPDSFEYNDMMAKVYHEQANAERAKGNTATADNLELDSNRYRGRAEEAKESELPLSPFVALASIGLVALAFRHRREKARY